MDREINTQSGLDRRESFQRTEILDNSPGTELEPKVYHPLSLPLLALLAPASILGLLARLGLVALATYDGQSIFALAYVQAVGCLIMGFGLGMKEPLEKLCVR
jgi:CrcB protein